MGSGSRKSIKQRDHECIKKRDHAQFTDSTWCGVGRPPHERAWLANAFVAKKVFGLTTTIGLIERLSVDRALRRICGFPLCKKLPSEATFSRAFEEFAEGHLPQRVHEALIKEYLGDLSPLTGLAYYNHVQAAKGSICAIGLSITRVVLEKRHLQFSTRPPATGSYPICCID